MNWILQSALWDFVDAACVALRVPRMEWKQVANPYIRHWRCAEGAPTFSLKNSRDRHSQGGYIAIFPEGGCAFCWQFRATEECHWCNLYMVFQKRYQMEVLDCLDRPNRSCRMLLEKQNEHVFTFPLFLPTACFMQKLKNIPQECLYYTGVAP